MEAECLNCCSHDLVYHRHGQQGFVLRCTDCGQYHLVKNLGLEWVSGDGVCGDRCNINVCQNPLGYHHHDARNLLFVRPYCARILRVAWVELEKLDAAMVYN